jgi:hypothetical protein
MAASSAKKATAKHTAAARVTRWSVPGDLTAQRQQEWWDQAQTEVRGRLARIDRGETSAPARVVRCLRVFVALAVRG